VPKCDANQAGECFSEPWKSYSSFHIVSSCYDVNNQALEAEMY